MYRTTLSNSYPFAMLFSFHVCRLARQVQSHNRQTCIKNFHHIPDRLPYLRIRPNVAYITCFFIFHPLDSMNLFGYGRHSII